MNTLKPGVPWVRGGLRSSMLPGVIAEGMNLVDLTPRQLDPTAGLPTCSVPFTRAAVHWLEYRHDDHDGTPHAIPAAQLLAVTGRETHLKNLRRGSRGGIKGGMNQYPSFREACDGLGDKVVDALVQAVELTQRDYLTYRVTHPDWVAAHTPRGLANWIHDIMWSHVVRALDGVSGIHIVDKGVTREILVGINLRVRVKRHDQVGAVASYPTQGALDFFDQDVVAVFDGMEETRLIAGYLWIPDTLDIGAAVLSLRDGKNSVIWMDDLPTAPTMPVATPINPPVPEPTMPVITLKMDENQTDEQAEGESEA